MLTRETRASPRRKKSECFHSQRTWIIRCPHFFRASPVSCLPQRVWSFSCLARFSRRTEKKKRPLKMGYEFYYVLIQLIQEPITLGSWLIGLSAWLFVRSIYKLAGVAKCTFIIKVFTFLYRLAFALRVNHRFVIWRKLKFYILLWMNIQTLL